MRFASLARTFIACAIVLYAIVGSLIVFAEITPEEAGGEAADSSATGSGLTQQQEREMQAAVEGGVLPAWVNDDPKYMQMFVDRLNKRYGSHLTIEKVHQFPDNTQVKSRVNRDGTQVKYLELGDRPPGMHWKEAKAKGYLITLEQNKRANIRGTADGGIEVEYPDDGNTWFGGDNIEIDGSIPGGMKAVFASQARTGNGLLTVTNGEDLEVYYDRVKVGKADVVEYSCVRFFDVVNADFTASPSEVRMSTSSLAPVKITDCANRQLFFTSYGEGSFITIAGDGITIANGGLNCTERGKVDTMEANESAVINLGASCFECLLIQPIGSYYYYDDRAREKDFAVRIPKDGKKGYRFCLRKLPLQAFKTYDGLGDLVDKRVELKGKAQYKKYPLKYGKAADILMETAYEGKADVRADITLFPEFIFVDTVALAGINASEANVSSVTIPNNYYTFTEELIGGTTRRVAALDYDLLSIHLTQALPSWYVTDTGMPGINITTAVAVQDNGRHRVTILGPVNAVIKGILG